MDLTTLVVELEMVPESKGVDVEERTESSIHFSRLSITARGDIGKNKDSEEIRENGASRRYSMWRLGILMVSWLSSLADAFRRHTDDMTFSECIFCASPNRDHAIPQAGDVYGVYPSMRSAVESIGAVKTTPLMPVPSVTNFVLPFFVWFGQRCGLGENIKR
ncbi:hypothetical protein BD410DRAFT_802726 [Rickenella mellea]|uniref:Uncharacterized protein n=1 Tax=Rickenella mellea TaxID=50990 RepID=A0A4Y7Q9K4_9AGAM|nr:hypothetical protein BD410DRAFT_802726 [Rickenella mellea]